MRVVEENVITNYRNTTGQESVTYCKVQSLNAKATKNI